jgi:hypothetical protein
LFRESLAGVYRLYPRTKDMVLISHSLGGLLSKMQTISTGRAAWDGVFGSDADRLYAKVPPDNLVKRALIFEANPRVKRVVFICVPHRGSSMADLSFAGWFSKLIRLPGRFVTTLSDLPAAVSLNAPANQVSANNHIFPGFFAKSRRLRRPFAAARNWTYNLI